MINELNFEPEFMADFCEDVLRIAERKMAESKELLAKNPPVRPLLPRLATGGGFTGLFLWDSCFCTMWAKFAPERFPVTTTLDNFYNLQQEDGFICREFKSDGRAFWSKEHPISFNPPILSWAEIQLYDAGVTGIDRLRQVYPKLKKHYEFCRRTYRRSDGLYFGDALGCGMDDLPRMPFEKHNDAHSGIDIKPEHITVESRMWDFVSRTDLYCWNRQMGWIDISSQMALNALNMKRIAALIGKQADAEMFAMHHAELAEIINEKCFDESRGFYFDFYNGKVIPRYHAGAFWVMIAGVVPRERISQVVAVLRDEKIFNRPVPFPSLGACDKDYDPEKGYWPGPVWPPTAYVAIQGLRAMGEEEEAVYFARKYYNAVAELYRKTGTVFENISPEQYDHPKEFAGRDFCGWAALAPVALYHDFFI